LNYRYKESDDVMRGGTGDDLMSGDAGDDRLEGGDGTDTCYAEFEFDCEL
jgi:Ca2+-binding RTX toxin-like protein